MVFLYSLFRISWKWTRACRSAKLCDILLVSFQYPTVLRWYKCITLLWVLVVYLWDVYSLMWIGGETANTTLVMIRIYT